MTISLIISTYKSPRFLESVLESVLLQTVLPSEIIVTEDGEFEDNRAVVEKFRNKMKTPLIHLTQKDRGNRKPLALNKAIARAEGEYLIFIDGDCVLRSDFIETHLEMADEHSFITGRRVELSEKAAQMITPEKVASGYLNGYPWRLFWDSLVGETQYLGRFFKTPKALRHLLRQDAVDDIRGCNFSVYRKHMIAINGFSNDFSGAYGEDSDVEIRLKFLGLQMKSAKGAAIQYHLWHKTQTKDESNQQRLQRLLESKRARTENGLAEADQIA